MIGYHPTLNSSIYGSIYLFEQIYHAQILPEVSKIINPRTRIAETEID